MIRTRNACIALLVAPAPSWADTNKIRPGLYAIEYRLELPHLERFGVDTRVERCTEGESLPIFSAKNAFENCSLEDRVIEEKRLRYSLICEGVSTGRAFADYKLTLDGFSGRVLVKLGGKNMTLTEVQSGRWLSECPASKTD